MFPKNRINRHGNGLVQASIEDMVSGHLKPSGQVEENAKDDNAKDTRHGTTKMVRVQPVGHFSENRTMLVGNDGKGGDFHGSIDGYGNSWVHRDGQKGLEGGKDVWYPVACVVDFEGSRDVGKSKYHESADQKASEKVYL